MRNRVSGILSIICAAGALPLLATPAGAQECVDDADCYQNWACEVVGEMGCAVACPEGQECDIPVDCVAEEIKECVAQPCESDDQCEEGMVCHTETREECSGGSMVDCRPGSECPEPTPVECETVTESACVPGYALPCQQDSDCGEGFACVEAEECWCEGSGTAGAGGGSGGAPADADGGAAEPQSGSGEDDPAPVPEGDVPVSYEEQCTCEPTGEYYCEMQEIACASDSDCPQGWACEADPWQAVSCSVPEGGSGECVPDPVEVSMVCLPPFSDLGGYGRGWGAEASTGGVALLDGGSTKEETLGDSPAEGGGGTGSTELTSSDGTEADGDAAESKGDDGGCRVANVGSNAAGGTLAWLAGLLGLLALRRRRRG